MIRYWLYWIASFLIVVAILSIGAFIQEWWTWRRETKRRDRLR